MLLSACLTRPVRRDGRLVGHVRDLGAAAAAPEPVVAGVVVARRGRPPAWIPWGAVAALDADGTTLTPGTAEATAVPELVLLGRDVLDAQILDLAGRRVVRVGDVDLRLRDDDGTLVVSGVETGLDSVLRRLGLRRLAAHVTPETVPWGELHLPAHPGATLTLETARPALERLTPAEHRRLTPRLGAHLAAGLWHVPHGRLRLRFPTHVLRRRRARP